MGRHFMNSLATIASVFLVTAIWNVDSYSPVTTSQLGFKTPQHFQTARTGTVLNLLSNQNASTKVSTPSLSKRGLKAPPSITEVRDRFSWKLPSVTPQDDEQASPPAPLPTNPDNFNRNLLATASVILFSTFVIAPNLPGLSDSLPMLSEKIASTGFYQSFSLVFVSEIGDKTFFIAGLLAMKSGRLISFIGSILALAGMTVLSVLIGQIFHAVPAEVTQGLPLDDIAAVIAFTFFGVKTLIEANECDEDGDGCGIDAEFAGAEEAVEGSGIVVQASTWAKIASTFGLVFAAEFGDRSFLSTIALSAAQNPFSVAAGSIVAHALATGIAVTGGSYVAKYISERTIGFIGGSLFLVFALTTAFGLF